MNTFALKTRVNGIITYNLKLKTYNLKLIEQ